MANDNSQPASSSTTTSPVARGRRTPRRRFLALSLLTVATTVGIVLGFWYLFRDGPELTTASIAAPELLAKQLSAVNENTRDSISISGCVASDSDLEVLRGNDKIRTLLIDDGIITDAGMETIGSLKNLVHLRVRLSPISDAGLAHLKGLSHLRVLNLPQADPSQAGLEVFNDLQNLRQLRIGGNRSLDISRQVSQLKQLRAVHLINVPVSDESLKLLSSLPRLESLYLDNPQVTEGGWEWLFANHPEIHLHVNQMHHDKDPNWHSHKGSSELEPTVTDGDPANLKRPPKDSSTPPDNDQESAGDNSEGDEIAEGEGD